MRTCSKCFRVCCLSFCSARTYFFSMLNTWRGCRGQKWKKKKKKKKKCSDWSKILLFLNALGSEGPQIHPLIGKHCPFFFFCNFPFKQFSTPLFLGNSLFNWPLFISIRAFSIWHIWWWLSLLTIPFKTVPSVMEGELIFKNLWPWSVFVAAQAFLWLQREGTTLKGQCAGFLWWRLLLWSSPSSWAWGLQQQLWLLSLRAQALYLWPSGLSCSEACGIFRDQRSNLCPLHWQVDS